MNMIDWTIFGKIFGISLAILLVTHFLFRENKTMNRLYLTPVLSAVIIALILSLFNGSGTGFDSGSGSSLGKNSSQIKTDGEHPEDASPPVVKKSETESVPSTEKSKGGSGGEKSLHEKPQDVTIKCDKGKYKWGEQGMKADEIMKKLKHLNEEGKLHSLKCIGDCGSFGKELQKEFKDKVTLDNGK